MVRWEVRFEENGKPGRKVYSGRYTESEIRTLFKEEHPGKNITNISGAFDPLPGRKMILGSHAINSSLDLGLAYSKSGNKFHELVKPELERLRQIVEQQAGTPEAEAAMRAIMEAYQSLDVGMADIIDFCEAEDGRDNNINLGRPISWNSQLPELIREADIVYLNGKPSTKGKGPYELLKKYCEQCETNKMRVTEDNVFVDGRQVRLVKLYSSSDVGYNHRYQTPREKEWASITGREPRDL